MEGKGHPLPASDESRHDQVPEDLIEEKGFGDDAAEPVQPDAEPVNPDGERYGRAEDVETGEGGGRESLGPGTPI